METMLKRKKQSWYRIALCVTTLTCLYVIKTMGMEEEVSAPYSNLVNAEWLENKKNTNGFVLILFRKENDNTFVSLKGDIKISIEEKDGISKIANAPTVSEKLFLNKNKWALFEIKEENELKYLYCSDIESCFDNNYDFGIFYNKQNFLEVNIVVCDCSEIKRTSAMFACCEKLTSLNLEKLNTVKVEDMRNMFSACKNLETITLFGNVSNVINMAFLFYDCQNLTKLSGIEKWCVEKVCEVSNMFYKCKRLEIIKGLDKWNISGVKDLSGMFAYCEKLKQIEGIEKWNTSNVVNVEKMFSNCKNLSDLNWSGWDLINIERVSNVFEKCRKLKKISLNKQVENSGLDVLGKIKSQVPNLCCVFV